MRQNEQAVAVFIFTCILVGSSRGLLPAWLTVAGSISIGLVFTLEIFRLFRGAGFDSSAANATTGISFEPTAPSQWANLIGKQQTVKTVNCRNCGGPNVNQVKCEWCGQVL